jgi:hypothetical protein
MIQVTDIVKFHRFLSTQVFSVSTNRFEDTVVMMMLVIKVTSFAWSSYDGTRPDKVIYKNVFPKVIV